MLHSADLNLGFHPLSLEENIRSWVARHGSPLLLVSRRTLVENYQSLRAQLPRVRLYYAVKSNPNQDILRTLAQAGSGFDVASSGELAEVLAVSVAPQDILYTNPIKMFGEIERLCAAGIRLFFYDNLAELDKIAQHAPGAEVILRLAVVNPNCVVDLGAKFGCSPRDAEDLLMAAVSRGLTPRGLGFHVGSQTSIPQPYTDMIVACRNLFNRMALAGYPLRTLDIGGGFPISYKTHMMSLASFCKPIREALEGFFPNTEILAEPGRVLSATAVKLIARVIGKARRQGIMWYYIEDGIYGSFSGRLFDHASYEIACLKAGDPEPCVLAGPTCDSFDVISREEYLPPLDIGDLIVAHHMGAYTSASATSFNGIPVTRAVLVD